MKVVVVIPTYNESDSIEKVIRLIRRAADVGVLIVDDASPDGTADLAEKVGGEIGGVTVLRRTGVRGFAASFKDGFTEALEQGADVVMQMDADLQHDPFQIPDFLAAIEHSDAVLGSRYIPGGSIPQWSLSRRLLSRWGNIYAGLMLGYPLKDMTSGYRAWRADTLKSLDYATVDSNGYSFQLGMVRRAIGVGARVTEVPIRFIDRELGESKMSTSIVVEAMILVTRWGVVGRLQRLRGRRRT
ncbi:MAG TPA: polyprenol monophosphomannose synthase [Acidimicrobiales bacterium]|nr:polyprenol monophosphomannose synthase [Acidimicrobiales bacterium]